MGIDEQRVLIQEGNRQVAYLRNSITKVQRAVLPATVSRVRTLVLGLDEGSIGSAGVAALAFRFKVTVWAKFDKIHRLIRDLKLAESDCCNKIFAKAKLWTSYLYGLNNRPFGSGANHTAKERLMSVFQAQEDWHGPTFQRYLSRVAKDLGGMPIDSPEEQQAVFTEMCEMTSFHKKLAQPKASNWFAWNDSAKVQIKEFNGTKCIFAATQNIDGDPDDDGPFESPTGTKDPKAQLQAILKGGGGIPMAFKLMKSDLNHCAKIMYTIEQGSWTFYTDEIKNTMSPKHAYLYSLRMAGAGWKSERHLWETLAPLRDPDAIRFMEIPMGESKWAERAVLLAWSIYKRRVWSLAKHSMPPESNALLLSPSAEIKARAATELKQTHVNFLLLERRAIDKDDAASLRRDMIFLDSPAVRLIFEFYARDKYCPSSASGKAALMVHIWSLADNKIIEDLHQPIRLNARANVTKKLSTVEMQRTILDSDVIEKRGINHRTQVDKAHWAANYKSTKVYNRKKRHSSWTHKVPKEWSRMMKPFKDWPTLNEDSLQRAAAAWIWMNTYIDRRCTGSLPETTRIGDARMSKLAPPCVILQHDDGQTIASMGNRVWAFLGLPVGIVHDVYGEVHYQFAPGNEVMWFHITAPDKWSVVPFAPGRYLGCPFRELFISYFKNSIVFLRQNKFHSAKKGLR